MTVELLQDAVVTGVAMLAAVVVLRRVFAFVRPGKAAGGCASCESGNKTCATTAQSAPAAGQPQILRVVRAPASAAHRPQVEDRVDH